MLFVGFYPRSFSASTDGGGYYAVFLLRFSLLLFALGAKFYGIVRGSSRGPIRVSLLFGWLAHGSAVLAFARFRIQRDVRVPSQADSNGMFVVDHHSSRYHVVYAMGQ